MSSEKIETLQAEIERLEHLVEVGKVEFDRLGHDHVLAVCRNAAYSCLEQHSYMQSLKTEYQSWAPHKWVIDAIRSLIGINRSTCENLREERDQLKARNAELEKDREALEYLMGQFEVEVCVCDRCRDEKEMKDSDSAFYLRRYLSKPDGSEQ